MEIFEEKLPTSSFCDKDVTLDLVYVYSIRMTVFRYQKKKTVCMP